MNDGGLPRDVPRPIHDLPQIPYDRITAYTAHLRDFIPQVADTIVRVGGEEIDFQTIHKADGSQTISLSIERPIHEAALAGIASSIYEHLNLATTEISTGRDDFQYWSETLSLDDFNKRFPDSQLSPEASARLNTIYVVLLQRKEGKSQSVQPILYFRPNYVVDNTLKYKHRTDQKFFANLYNDITVTMLDKRPEMAKFITQYGLCGFPWPERRME